MRLPHLFSSTHQKRKTSQSLQERKKIPLTEERVSINLLPEQPSAKLHSRGESELPLSLLRLDSQTLTENVKSRKLNLQDVLCILSQIFFALKLRWRCTAASALWKCVNCVSDHSFNRSSAHLFVSNLWLLICSSYFGPSPLQPATWAAIGVRSQTCWIRAFRSARSASSSRPTTASSFCAASGTRASGCTPLTQVLYNHSTYPPSALKSGRIQAESSHTRVSLDLHAVNLLLHI